MSKARREAGFTLLELLVAITVLSLVALVMLGGLTFSARVVDRGEAAAADSEEVEVAQNLLRNQISRIYPRWVQEQPAHIAFDGKPRSMEFIAPRLQQFGPGPNQVFQISLSSAGDLEFAWNPQQPSSSAILRHIRSAEFSYFGPLSPGAPPVWTDNWTNRTRLPQLIRIRVSFYPEDRRVWPELVVHPDTRVDVTCIYDPISRGCRGRPE